MGGAIPGLGCQSRVAGRAGYVAEHDLEKFITMTTLSRSRCPSQNGKEAPASPVTDPGR